MSAGMAAQQRALWQAATAGGGDGLPVCGSPGWPPAARAQVYGRAYRARTQEALAADFPRCAALLGGVGFAAAAAAYLARCPSRSPDIGLLGDRLAAHFARHPPPAARPDLAALAELEWARVLAGRAALGPAVTAAHLANSDGARLGRARLRLAPHLVLRSLDHDPCPLWRALAVAPAALPAPAAAAVVVAFRRGEAVVHHALAPAAGRALTALAAGEPLAVALGAFDAVPRPAAAAFAALGGWVADGLVAAVLPCE